VRKLGKSLTGFIGALRKELKLFFRRKTTTALVVLSPLIIIFFLGALFSDADTGTQRLPVGYCDFDQTDISASFVAGLSNFGLLSLKNYAEFFSNEQTCREFLQSNTKRGALAFSFVIPQGFRDELSAGRPQTMQVLFENSRTNLVGLEKYYVEAVTKQVSNEISKQVITKAWARLAEADQKLSAIIAKMPELDDNLAKAQQQLDKIESNLNQPLEGISSNITRDLSTQLEGADQQLSAMEDSLAIMKFALNDAADSANSVSNGVTGLRFGIESAQTSINDLSNGLNCSGSASAACSLVQTLKSKNEVLLSSLTGVSNSAIIANNKAAQALTTANTVSLALSQARSRLSTARQQLESSQTLANQQVQALRSSASQQMQTQRQNLDNVRTQLQQTESSMRQTHEELAALVAQSPESILNPVKLEAVNAFDEGYYKKIDFAIYGIMTIIIMLSALLLSSTNMFREKSSSTYDVSKISFTGALPQALAKIIANALVMTVEILVILAISVFVFGVKFQQLGFLVAILSCLSVFFIALGMLLGMLARSENTAILSSITLAIPAIFASDLVIPFELMDAKVQAISNFLPTTMAINALKHASLYNNPLRLEASFGALVVATALAALLAYLAMTRSRNG